MLPSAIQEQFVAVLAGHLPLADFEQWVYATPVLEAALVADDYLELISFNYRQRDALYLLEPLLMHHVSWGEVRRVELLGLLHDIVARTSADQVMAAMNACYHWYCNGCDFLEKMGLNYGLEMDYDYGWRGEKGEWVKLTEEEKWHYLNIYYPAARHEAEEVINWLNTGLIRFEDDIDATSGIAYVDRRPIALQKRASTGIDPFSPVGPPWWKFWQKRS
jgi:hypothetical protein